MKLISSLFSISASAYCSVFLFVFSFFSGSVSAESRSRKSHRSCSTSSVRTPPRASIVIDYNSGQILYCSNPYVRTQPASMTKMMTLLLLFKALRQGKVSRYTLIHISKNAASQKPCKLGLKCGEVIRVQDAILALITKSANDVAVAVAERLAGSEKRFVKRMNEEAKNLGMYSTIFRNASGWKDPQQLTTVGDMAKLSKALIGRYQEFFPLFSTRGFNYRGRYYRNHNHLLGEHGGITVDGLKTGFVCASGYNIAVTAKKGSERVIVVVVGGKSAQNRDKLVRWLLTSSFNKLSRQRFIAEQEKKQGNETPKKEDKEDKEKTNKNGLRRDAVVKPKRRKKSAMRMILEKAHLLSSEPEDNDGTAE